MTESTRYDVRHGVAVIEMRHAPVNSLSAPLRAGIFDGLDKALSDDGVRAIVLYGSGLGFSGGADVKEFGTPRSSIEPRLGGLITMMESAAKPVVAAITGICLGGGFELALAAHYRVAKSDAQLGLPEVKLGLLPGCGGTQRLPRAVGLERALNMIVSGQIVSAGSLAGTPLLDAVTEGDPLSEAISLASRVASEGLPLKRLRDANVADRSADAFISVFRKSISGSSANATAATKCIDAVARSVSVPFDKAIQAEREDFLTLMNGTESKALRHNFFAERMAQRVPGVDRDTPMIAIRSVGVIGAGTMGTGIAMNFLNAGLPVVLVETGQQQLDRGMNTIRQSYASSVKRGKLSEEEAQRRIGLIQPSVGFDALSDADLVIEAVFEDYGVKQDVFRKMDAVCKVGAILASNTSYLNIDQLADLTSRPERVLGLHFFSPAHMMKLLEVVRGAKTSPEVMATAMHLAKTIGKVAVVSGVCDGFIGNRMLSRYIAASNDLITRGALPEDVDQVLQNFGMALGPFRMGDLAGLDIGWATRKRKAAEAGLPHRPIIADKLCEARRFGQKTGAGWYRYEEGSRVPKPDAETRRLIESYRAENGILPRKIGADEIVARCIYALINEAARILEDGIAARASDIDVVYVNGYGFPAGRGGPMFYADSVGLPYIVRSLRGFASQPGADASWQPSPLLVKLASAGETFN